MGYVTRGWAGLPPAGKLALITPAIAIPFIPFVSTGNLFNYGIFILIYALLALGLNVVVGFAGLLDLGYVAFFGFGAYTYAFLSGTHHARERGWRLPRPLAVAVTFLLVVLGWVLFRMRTAHGIADLYAGMLSTKGPADGIRRGEAPGPRSAAGLACQPVDQPSAAAGAGVEIGTAAAAVAGSEGSETVT